MESRIIFVMEQYGERRVCVSQTMSKKDNKVNKESREQIETFLSTCFEFSTHLEHATQEIISWNEQVSWLLPVGSGQVCQSGRSLMSPRMKEQDNSKAIAMVDLLLRRKRLIMLWRMRMLILFKD
jgi:hypothetical protein